MFSRLSPKPLSGSMGNTVVKSLWEATAIAAPAITDCEIGGQFDVAVVGAGVSGLSTALHLAETGARVVVLDACEIGWGASGRSGGGITPLLKPPPDQVERLLGRERGARLTQMASDAPDLVFRLIDRHGIECHPVRTGWLLAVHKESARRRVERLVESWQARGAPVTFLDRKETEQVLGSRIYYGAMLDKRAGTVHPLSYTRGLANAALLAGAKICPHTEAARIARDNGSWTIIMSDERKVSAETVVLACNAYPRNFADRLGRMFIAPTSVILATEPLSASILEAVLPDRQAVADSRRLLTYYRIAPSGQLVIGGRGPFGDPSRASHYRSIERTICKIFPQMGQPRIDYRWYGRICLTIDGLPRICEFEPNLYAMLGYNGRGLALATAFGKHLADRLSQGTSQPDDLTNPLRPIRLHGLRRFMVATVGGIYRALDIVA